MSVDDLSDFYADLREMQRRIRRLETSSMLENSSITRGRMRFIGGTLRVDSGGKVEIVGTLDVDGTTSITGPTTITGRLDVDGPWSLDGNGDITGNVELTGRLNMPGNPAMRLQPGNGNTPARIRLGTTSGDPVVQGGSGLTGIVMPDGSAGALVGSGGATIFQGDNPLGGYDHAVTATAGGVAVVGLESVPSGTPTSYVVADANGRLYKASPNGGGDPGTPGTPGDNLGGYIYPVNPNAWTLGDDYQDHVNRGSLEPGIDWWTSIGTPVWAPGDGTVVDVQTSYAGATGAYVTLVTDAGDWFRFLHNSSIEVAVNDTVTQGQVLAYTGGSGFGSPAGYGPHTHVSFKQGYTGTWPGGSALDDFEAYMEVAN